MNKRRRNPSKRLDRTKRHLKVLRIYSLLTLLPFFVSLSSALALEPAVKELVTNETKANAVALRSDEMVKVENFEIPLRLLKADVSSRMPPDVRKSLIFKKNGEEYVRWIINPEDTKWHLEVEKFLKANGIEPTHYTYFEGYQTASRSYIVEDPKTKSQFSLKVSTNKTGGNWTDKKQDAVDAFDVRRSMDYVMKVGEDRPYTNFKIMDEPASFGIEAIDQGMIVRTLNDLPEGNKIYVPGFSAVHSEVGRKIARLNGSNNPAEFWNKNYNKPLARALAELAAKTGIAFDSPHSQNFLVELDKNYKPTGKIILRDLGDIYINPEIATANGGKALVASWPKENLRTGKISAYVGTLHGNNFPDWMDEKIYDKWGEDFFKEYDKELARQTRIAREKLPVEYFRSGRYFGKEISVKTPEWQDYLRRLEARADVAGGLVSSRSPSSQKGCQESFRNLQ